VCSVAGHVVPTNVFYAYPGDSVSCSLTTCRELVG